MADQPRKPQASKPDLGRINVDAVVGAGKEHAASLDHVRPELAHRSQTLNGLGTVKPSPPIPPAGGLPTEYAPTRPAPAPDFDRKRTVRVPTPPSAAIRARRTDPPTTSEASEPEDAPASQPGPSALPPPSHSPAEAAAAAKDRELARLRRERDEARAAIEQAKNTASIVPDGSLESLRKAQTKLYLGIAAALVALAVPLGAYLTAAAEANRSRSERAATQAGNAVNAADSAKQTASNADKEIARLRAELAQYRANMREVLRLQGIDVAKRAGDPDPNDLDPVVPFCPRGKVCPGPSLQLRNPP